MSRRRPPPHRWTNHPELLTSIRSPQDKLRKAEWNFDRYEDAIMARPCDSEAVVYTALDFCIAIAALRDWTKAALGGDSRRAGKQLPLSLTSLDDFSAFVETRVPWQPTIEAIANTAKHARYRDTGWEDGVAMVNCFVPESLQKDMEACEDGVDLLRFMNQHRDTAWWDISLRQDSQAAEQGHVAFGDTLDRWRSILRDLNLIDF